MFYFPNLFSDSPVLTTSPEPPAPPPSTPQVLRYRSIWVSDLHLGTRGCQAERFLDFLRHTESDFLYLVGDIIDGWQLKKRWYWPQPHNDVVQKILRRAHKGTEVCYIPGNHDEAARDFSGLRFGGVLVTNEAIHTTAQGKRLLIIHGDSFDAVMIYARWLAELGDTAYTVILAVNRWFNLLRRKMGLSYWSLSSYLKNRVKNAVAYITAFETFIANEARRRRADGIVCGHIHQAQIKNIGSTAYYNDGDWVESCTALVEDMQGNLFVLNWAREREALLSGQMPALQASVALSTA